MRAAVAGVEDAIEFKIIGNYWFSDKGTVVTFEFQVERGIDFLQIMPAMHLQEGHAHCAAGGDCVLRRMAGSGGNGPLN